MRLIIDGGNTITKLAVFERDTVLEFKKVATQAVSEELIAIQKSYPNIAEVMLSSVSNLTKNVIQKNLDGIVLMELNYKLSFPFNIMYKTPKTLGVDRLALMCGAYKEHFGSNCLVIDAGTCITYDFLTSEGQYLGGGISPGLQLRYKSLNDHTANLPYLEATNFENYIIGDTTENAIHAGVCNGFINEINGIITQFSNKYKPLVVILTGGDAHFLSKRLKNGIFVDPKILIKGLNFIFEYNIDK